MEARPRRYCTLWRNKFLTLDAKSLDDMIQTLAGAVECLKEMRAAGVALDDNGSVGDDYAYLYTTDPVVAERFGLTDERELFGCEDEEEEEDPSPEDTGEEEAPGTDLPRGGYF